VFDYVNVNGLECYNILFFLQLVLSFSVAIFIVQFLFFCMYA
jgi:hypothetical protein